MYWSTADNHFINQYAMESNIMWDINFSSCTLFIYFTWLEITRPCKLHYYSFTLPLKVCTFYVLVWSMQLLIYLETNLKFVLHDSLCCFLLSHDNCKHEVWPMVEGQFTQLGFSDGFRYRNFDIGKQFQIPPNRPAWKLTEQDTAKQAHFWPFSCMVPMVVEDGS